MQILLLLTSLSLLSSTAFPLRANLSTNLDTTKFTPLSRRWTEPYGIAVCRGIRLSWAMQLPANLASQFLTPITSQFEDGNFNDALHSWGYSEGDALFERLCDFDTTHGLTTAFRALNIDPRSTERGGPNHCFHVQHQYTGSAKPVQDQVYWVGDRRYRMTNAYFSIGINPDAGFIFLLNRRSPAEGARMTWGVDNPARSELPALRASSDIVWGFHSRVNWGRFGNVRAFLSTMITNTETEDIIEQILEDYNAELPEGRQEIDAVPPWPGMTFDTDDVAGQALLGSPNGLAAGFFLAQHKQQLGGDKVIRKIILFRAEEHGSMPNLLFWVA